MPRDSTGSYTSPSSQFSSGTTISSSVMNGKLNDIGEELTDSLSRSGKGAMTAALRVPDGSIALPSYTFTNETNLGWFRSGTGEITAVDGSTEIMKWSTTEVRVYSAAVFQDTLEVATGITAFASSNSPAITATGTGTGDGIVATGGATGDGGTFSGGASSGRGVVATGVGTSSGIVATGGATGAGGTFQGGATSGAGINVTGGPSSTGANITGGSGNAAGAAISGTGSGVGAQIAAGTAATDVAPTNALELTNGNLKLSGAEPGLGVAMPNTLTPLNIPKVVATITTDGSGNVAITDGFNVTSVAFNANVIRVTMPQAFADTNYTGIVTADQVVTMRFVPVSTTIFELYGYTWEANAGTLVNLASASYAGRYYVTVFGRQ